MECSLAAAHAYSVLLKEANLINNVGEPVGVGATTVLDKSSQQSQRLQKRNWKRLFWEVLPLLVL
jgi:hypothetical protein